MFKHVWRAALVVVSSESASQKTSSQPEGGDFDHVPNKRRKQFLSVLVALGAMLSYALLTGMVSIQHAQQEALEEPPDLETLRPHDHEEEDDGWGRRPAKRRSMNASSQELHGLTWSLKSRCYQIIVSFITEESTSPKSRSPAARNHKTIRSRSVDRKWTGSGQEVDSLFGFGCCFAERFDEYQVLISGELRWKTNKKNHFRSNKTINIIEFIYILLIM